jgi:flagella basal body P-ring formation protein FlgA
MAIEHIKWNSVEEEDSMTEKRRTYYRIILCLTVALGLTVLSIPFAGAASLDLEGELKEYLEKHYPWNEIEVSNVQSIGKVENEAPEKIIVERGPLGKAIFSLHFENSTKIIVNANVRALDWVVKSKRPFRKGHVVHRDDVYVSKMDIRKMPSSAISDPAIIIGKSLKRSVIANIPIVEGMIEQSQVVKRGKKIILMIESGGFNITATGRIKEKGYVGMPVRAMNLSSKKEVRGILIDENTVRVEM